jgi:thymidylate synthase
MKQYHDLLRRILDEGERRENRTGTDTLSIFGHQMRFDLREGFPLVTTKKVHLKSIVYELFWMLNGDTNIKYLNDRGVTIWDEWADDDGELGPVYGSQWRAWWTLDGHVDQIAQIVETLRTKPHDRRILLSSWTVGQLADMRLPPCHLLAQFSATNKGLSCHMYIRSWDVFLGGPFNIAQYALLTHLIARTTNLPVGDLIISSGDTHLYVNHLEQARLQLGREPRPLPRLVIQRGGQDVCSRRHGCEGSIDGFQLSDIRLDGYDPHPHIAGNVAV